MRTFYQHIVHLYTLFTLHVLNCGKRNCALSSCEIIEFLHKILVTVIIQNLIIVTL